jgi:hypothetical protein
MERLAVWIHFFSSDPIDPANETLQLHLHNTSTVGLFLCAMHKQQAVPVTHGDREASDYARRESLREADLTHQGVETRIGSERIDEWIAK